MALQRVIDRRGRSAVLGDKSILLLRFMSNYYIYFGTQGSRICRLSSGEFFETFDEDRGWRRMYWPGYESLMKEEPIYSYVEDLTLIFKERNYVKQKTNGLPSLVKKANRFLKEQGYL